MNHRPPEESMIPFLDMLSKKWHVDVNHMGSVVEIVTSRQTVLHQIIDRSAEYENAVIMKRGNLYSINIKDKTPTIEIKLVKKTTIGRMKID